MTTTLEAPTASKTTKVEKNGAPLPIELSIVHLQEPASISPPAIPATATPDLFEKAICLAVSLRKPGNRRKLSASLVDVDADKDLISAQKILLSCEHLKTIDHYDGEIRRYLYTRCLPSLFKEGVYLVPIGMVEEVEAKLNAFADKRKQLVGAFVTAYPSLIEEAQKRLRAAFNPQDYPSSERMEANFRMEWRYIAFSVPGTLKTVSHEMFRKEQEKAQQQWAEALEEVRALLRTHLSELVQHLVDRLSGNDKGAKPKVFKNTLVTNMTEFLETFEARNLTDDMELASVVKRAKELLSGVDAQTLRTSTALRASLHEGFSDLKGTLDTLVVSKPTRAISFEVE